MQGAALYDGARAAEQNFYGQLYNAQATSFMSYTSISGISKDVADRYIAEGIINAAMVSMNYGCTVPVVPIESAARYANDINSSRESVNDKIYQVKANKEAEYYQYQEYLRQLELQRQKAQMEAALKAKLYGALGNVVSSLMSKFQAKTTTSSVPKKTVGNPRKQMSEEAKAYQTEEAKKFFGGLGASFKGTINGAYQIAETAVFLALGDEEQRQEGVERVKSTFKGIKNFVFHPIETISRLVSYIEDVAEEKGGSYVFGYVFGDFLQIGGGAAVKGAKTAKAADNVSDIGKVAGGKYSAFGKMSKAEGIRYRDWNYEKIRELSIHNPNADRLTLGKYMDGKIEYGSYVAVAEQAGDMYFSLGSMWDEIAKAYGLSETDMFNLFNKPALDYAVKQGKQIRFTHDPSLKIYADSALGKEWKYLKNRYGYTNLEKRGDYWYAK